MNVVSNCETASDNCKFYIDDELPKKEENDSACHSRNSSGASHLSKLSSHSRQSSSGESGSGHMRYVIFNFYHQCVYI